MARIAVLAVLLLALPASALGGGFATVQLSSLPEGTPAGGTWHAELTVLAHGRTPVDGLSPAVRIRKGGDVREFPAVPAGEPGRYRAEVEFPAAGTWQWEIADGYSQTHTYAPVTIVGGGKADSLPVVPLVGGAAAALLLAALAAVLLLRRRPHVPRVVEGAS